MALSEPLCLFQHFEHTHTHTHTHKPTSTLTFTITVVARHLVCLSCWVEGSSISSQHTHLLLVQRHDLRRGKTKRATHATPANHREEWVRRRSGRVSGVGRGVGEGVRGEGMKSTYKQVGLYRHRMLTVPNEIKNNIKQRVA